MTFAQTTEKFNKRFWWIFILLVIFNGVGFGWMQSQKFDSFFSFKLDLNKDFYEIESFSQLTPNHIILNENSLASSYGSNSGFVARYFQDFLLSGSTILKLKDLGALPDMVATDKATYTTSLMSNSVLEARSQFDSEVDALKFNQSLEMVTEKEISNWNQDKPKMLQLSLNKGESKVIAKSKPLQMKILPSLAAIIFGFALVLISPLKKDRNLKVQE